MKAKLFLSMCALSVSAAFGQGVRYDNSITTASSNVGPGAQAPIMTVPFAKVTISSDSACSVLAPVYLNQALTSSVAQPLTADALGRFGFWIPAGTYYYSYTNGAGLSCKPFTVGGGGGGGATIPATPTILKGTTSGNTAVAATAADVGSLFACSGTNTLLTGQGTCVAPGTGSGATAPATTSLYKGNGSANGITPATAGTDYITPTGSGAQLTGITPAQVGADALGSGTAAAAIVARGNTKRTDSFGQSTWDANFNACNQYMATNGGGTCDDTMYGGNQTAGTLLSCGVRNGSVTIVHELPSNANWFLPSGLVRYNGCILNSDNTSAGAIRMVLDTPSGATMPAVVTTDPNNYSYSRMHGVAIQNTGNATLTSGYALFEQKLYDGSLDDTVSVYNANGNGMGIQNVCCSAKFVNMYAYGSAGNPGSAASAYSNGGTPLTFLGGNIGISWEGTANAPQTGKHNIDIEGSEQGLSIHAYEEGDGIADQTTSMNYNNASGASSVTFDLMTTNAYCPSTCAGKPSYQNASTGTYKIRASANYYSGWIVDPVNGFSSANVLPPPPGTHADFDPATYVSQILVDAMPNSGTFNGVNCTTKLDCAWAKAWQLEAQTNTAQSIRMTSGTYPTATGLQAPATTTTGRGVSVFGVGKSSFDNQDGTTILLTATLTTPVIYYPYLSTASGNAQNWNNIVMSGFTINAAGLAPVCSDYEAPQESTFEHLGCRNAIGTRAHMRFGGISQSFTDGNSGTTITPIVSAGTVPSGYNGGGVQDKIRDIFDIKDGSTGPGAAITGTVHSDGTISGSDLVIPSKVSGDSNDYGTYDGVLTRPVFIKTATGGQRPCTTIGNIQAVIVGRVLDHFNTVTPYSGCSGAIIPFAPDMSMAANSVEIEGLTDSTFDDIVSNGAGAYALQTRGDAAGTLGVFHPTGNVYGWAGWGDGIQATGRGECDSLYADCFINVNTGVTPALSTSLTGYYGYIGGAYQSSPAYTGWRVFNLQTGSGITINNLTCTTVDQYGNCTNFSLSTGTMNAATVSATTFVNSPYVTAATQVQTPYITSAAGQNLQLQSLGQLYLGSNAIQAIFAGQAFYPNGTQSLGTSGAPWANVYGTTLHQNNNAVCDASGTGCAANDAAGSANTVQLYQMGKNIRASGAIGDGNSHPASSKFTTLAACQAVYTSCAALTDEIDTLAIEKAESIAITASTLEGDQIIAPSGTYVLNRTILIPVDTTQRSPAGVSYGISGAGHNATVFQPNATMLAAGLPVMACGNGLSDTPTNELGRYGPNGCSNTYSGFTLRPATTFQATQFAEVPPTVNGVNVTSDGLLAGGRMHLSDVVVQGFVHGYNFVGDHSVWENFSANYNEWNYYLAPESQLLYGDLTWINPGFSSATYADILVSKDAYLSVSISGQLYASSAPYSILGEAGTPDSYVGQNYLPILYNTTSANTLAEFLGNSFIVDANTFNGGTAIRPIIKTTLSHTSIIGCAGLANCAPFTGGGQNNNAWFNTGILSGLDLKLQANSMVPVSGMLAGIYATGIGPTFNGNYGGLDLEIYPELLTSAYASFPMFGGFTNGANDNSCQNVRITTGGEWTGTCINIPTAGSYYAALTGLAQGTVLRRFYGTQGVIEGAHDSVQFPVGVNMQNWTSSAVNGAVTIIATRGIVSGVPYTGSLVNGGLASVIGPGSIAPCVSFGNTTGPCSSGFQLGQVVGYTSTTASVDLSFAAIPAPAAPLIATLAQNATSTSPVPFPQAYTNTAPSCSATVQNATPTQIAALGALAVQVAITGSNPGVSVQVGSAPASSLTIAFQCSGGN